MYKKSKIFIAGHNGMVGSALCRKFKDLNFKNIITESSNKLDLRNQKSVDDFFNKVKPEYVFLAAAKVGGIYANNKYRADFIYDNIMIQCNIINSSHLYGVKKLLFLGSSCIYPKFANQPIKENEILNGKLEKTNQPYALAKISGIEMCDSYRNQYGSNFISVMPTNLYGTNDNYHPKNSHVLPSLIRKVLEAKKNKLDEIILWGTGSPKREFLHVDDLADACIFLMNNYNDYSPVNIGSGIDLTIKELALLIMDIANYNCKIKFDKTKPDGTPRKLLDVSKINNLGWKPSISLEKGILKTINEVKDLF
tara:strand:- start:2724 stop:3650 length:927 start_codon:yes stop_codon:yes gene_type:complete